MRDGDDRRRAFLLEDRQVLRRGVIGSTRRVCFSLSPVISACQAQADEADLQRAERLDAGTARRRRSACRCWCRRRSRPPIERSLRASAGSARRRRSRTRGCRASRVEAGGVQRGDHLLALEDARRDRRRQEIAGEDEERRASRPRRAVSSAWRRVPGRRRPSIGTVE